MPVHDWTRVGAGIFHDFHLAWIAELRNVLNGGLLPPDYYALSEQIVGDMGPDVLTLQSLGTNGPGPSPSVGEGQGARGSTAVAEAPPRVRLVTRTEADGYVRKQRTLVIRHSSDDRVVALIELLSPGNKASRHAMRSFVDKAIAALDRGYHLLLVDLHPPTPRDPQGIHGAIWSELGDDSYRAPSDEPLTLVAYVAGPTKTAYVEPIAVGRPIPDMPLFLDPEHYVPVPLGATYDAAWRGLPRRWRDVLDPPGAAS